MPLSFNRFYPIQRKGIYSRRTIINSTTFMLPVFFNFFDVHVCLRVISLHFINSISLIKSRYSSFNSIFKRQEEFIVKILILRINPAVL